MESQPPALLITGPPASGKSTLASAVAARLRAALLDQDVLAGALTAVVGNLVGTHDLDDPALAGVTRDARYEAIIATAVDNLRVGTPVVLVAPFTSERTDPGAWHGVRDRLRDAGGLPALVWLRLPADELVRRLRARGAARDRGKLADTAAFAGNTALLAPPVVEHIAVDATAGTEQQVEDIFSSLS
ncbi:AAA family ATPase [Actinophytocola sp.]|uniref:AAA family ATPase n=1 Tax=Actinophytocola sp. TaxID=1872138 RepID=UPI002ED3A085